MTKTINPKNIKFFEAEKETLKRLQGLKINCFCISESNDFKPTKKAPLIHTAGGSYSCPDIIAFQNNKPFFVEVKYRDKTIIYNGAEELAINKSNYLKYLEIEKQTGAPVWLAFYHPNQSGNPSDAIIYIFLINEYSREWDGVNSKTGQKITNTTASIMYDLRTAKRLVLPQKNVIKTFN